MRDFLRALMVVSYKISCTTRSVEDLDRLYMQAVQVIREAASVGQAGSLSELEARQVMASLLDDLAHVEGIVGKVTPSPQWEGFGSLLGAIKDVYGVEADGLNAIDELSELDPLSAWA